MFIFGVPKETAFYCWMLSEQAVFIIKLWRSDNVLESGIQNCYISQGMKNKLAKETTVLLLAPRKSTGVLLLTLMRLNFL